MERGNLDYVASLEQYIHLLRQILQEWTPYVPQEVLLKRKPLIERIYPSTAPITERRPAEISPSAPTNSTQSSQDDIDGLPSNAQEPKKETWRQSLETFVRKIPSANEWSEKTEALNRRTEDQTGIIENPNPSVLKLLLDDDSLPMQSEACAPASQLQPSGICRTLERYSARVRKRNANAQLYKRIATYEKFVLIALAHVVSFKDVEPKFVDEMMEHVSDGRSSDHLRGLRRGVSWAVQATGRLHKHGWDIRSGDIMFYFPPTFRALKIWSKSKDCLDTFVETLSPKKYTQAERSFDVNQLHMPCILKCIVRKNISLSDICQCLNSDFDISRKIFFECYRQPYGQDAIDDDETRMLCFPTIRSPPNDYTPNDQNDRAQKRRRTGPEAESTISTADNPAPATGIGGNTSAIYERMSPGRDERPINSSQFPHSNTDFWFIVNEKDIDGASSHNRGERSFNAVFNGNTYLDDLISPVTLENDRSTQESCSASSIDDIIWSAEPRFFMPRAPDGPHGGTNDTSDDPTAPSVDDIIWSAEPRFFMPTGSDGPHGKRTTIS